MSEKLLRAAVRAELDVLSFSSSYLVGELLDSWPPTGEAALFEELVPWIGMLPDL